MKTTQKTILQRTMIAAAIAALSAGAYAADYTLENLTNEQNKLTVGAGDTVTIEKGRFGDANGKGLEDWTINGGKLTVIGFDEKDNLQGALTHRTDADSVTKGSSKLTINGGSEVSVTKLGQVNVFDLAINGGTITIGADDDNVQGAALGAYSSFTMNGGDITLTNGGKLWLCTDPNVEGHNRVAPDTTMELLGGTITIDGGKLAAGDDNDADVMHLGGVNVNVTGEDSTIAAHEINQTAGSVTVADKGVLKFEDRFDQPDATAAVYNLTGGALNIAKGGFLELSRDINIVGEGAQLVNEGGMGGSFFGKSIRIADGGVLRTSAAFGEYDIASPLDFSKTTFAPALGTVQLDEGGTLELLSLNSNYENSLGGTPDTNAVNDQYLIQGYTVALDGGRITHNGSEVQYLKAGNNEFGGTINVNGGNYSFKAVTVASMTGSAFNLNEGTVSVDTFNVQGAGKATIGSDEGEALLIAGDLNIANQGGLVLDSGSLRTGVDQIVAKNADGTFNFGATTATWGNVVANADSALELTGLDSFTIDQYKTLAGVLGNNVDLLFQNSSLEGVDKLDISDVAGTYAAAYETVAVNKNQTGTTATNNIGTDYVGVGALKVNADTTDVTIEGTGEVWTPGLGGNFIQGVDEVENLTIDTFSIGYDASSSLNINAKNLFVNDLSVTGRVTAQNIELVGDEAVGEIDGSLAVSKLTGEGTMTVRENGELSFDLATADVDMESGATVVLGNRLVNERARDDVLMPQVGGAVVAGTNAENALLTTNRAAGESLMSAIKAGDFNQSADDDTTGFNGFYVDRTVAVDGVGGKITFGNVGDRGEGTVALGSNVITVIDLSAFKSGDTIFDAPNGLAVNYEGQMHVANVLSEKSVTLVNSSTFVNSDRVEFENANAWLNVAAKQGEGAWTLDSTFNEDITNDSALKEGAKKVLVDGGNVDNQRVLAAIGNKNGEFINENGQLTTRGEDATSEYLAMPVTAGTYNVAYDAAEQVTGTVQRRNLEPSTGLGVWADVFYSSNEAKEISGGHGYSADIYGGTIGFDGTFSCGAKLGLALSVGSGDADSEKSVGKYSNDADFLGVTLYTGKQIADTGLYFSADASYLWLDNDIDGHVAGASVKESIDSNVFTVGVRADMTVYDQAFKVVPHVGVRYTNIDVDDYRDLESDSMNVLELPIGVKVAGDFEPAAGWTLTPSFDFTVVPQVGDKDVNTLVGDVDVLDNVYNSTLGVNATYGNFAFGLSYRYGFGNDDRSNNAFQARASWQF